MSIVAAPMPAGRSRVSNGLKVLANVDGRTREGRRFRDILDALLVEFDVTDESDMQRCRIAVSFSLSLEDGAAKKARGEAVNIGEMVTTGNLLRRLLADLARSRRERRRAQRVSGAMV